MQIKDLVVNGILIKDREIIDVDYPSPDHAFWEFYTSEKTTIIATGNISFEEVNADR